MRRWLRRTSKTLAWLAAAMAAGAALTAWLVFRRDAFTLPSPTPSERAETVPAWWDAPPALTADEVAGQQWLADITCRLPESRRDEVWNVGGSQYGIYSVRYQAAFAGYAAAVLGQRTPAYPALTAAILRNCIDRLADRRAWTYIHGLWGDQPWFPDPCARENVMYTGHLLQLLALYEAASGDPVFRESGFDLVWDDAHRSHYTTLSLAEVTANQIRANACGGVPCEPGLVFFPCNDHPQVAFRLLEGMGVGDWRAERAKWETWALSSYEATAGGGAFRICYHLASRAFVPRGHPGLDGWALLWYAPWATDPATAPALWAMARTYIDWSEFGDDPDDRPPSLRASCCEPLRLPPATVACFLAAAARACGDAESATRLEAWLDRHFRWQADGRLWLETDHEWRTGVTATRLLSLAIEHGSDLRALVLRPLPRDYFRGLLLAAVEPDTTPIFAAYRQAETLVLELDGGGQAVTLRLTNAPAAFGVEGLAPGAWQQAADGTIRLAACGRTTLRVVPR